eukprot:jgi/Mesvir1/7929/Mv11851-RA.1
MSNYCARYAYLFPAIATLVFLLLVAGPFARASTRDWLPSIGQRHVRGSTTANQKLQERLQLARDTNVRPALRSRRKGGWQTKDDDSDDSAGSPQSAPVSKDGAPKATSPLTPPQLPTGQAASLPAPVPAPAGVSVPPEPATGGPPRWLMCPRGRYFNSTDEQIQERQRKLAAWFELQYRALHPGSASSGDKSSAEPFRWPAGPRRQWIYEDRQWPKPPRCGHLYEDKVAGLGPCQLEAANEWCVNKDAGFIAHLNWKAGTTSLQATLRQVFPGTISRLIGREDHPMEMQRCAERGGTYPKVPVPGSHIPRFLRVGMVRDPIERMLSGYREVYQRDIIEGQGFDRVQQGNGVGFVAKASWMLAGRKPGPVVYSPDQWAEHNKKGEVAREFSGPGWDEDVRFRAYIDAVECAHNFPWWEHTASQNAFFTIQHLAPSDGNSTLPGFDPSEPPEFDEVLRMETYNQDVQRVFFSGRLTSNLSDGNPLRREHTYVASADATEGGNATEEIRVARYNIGARYASNGVPRVAYLMNILHSDPTLLLRLCTVYMADYICFDYGLPKRCLALVPWGIATLEEESLEIEAMSEANQYFVKLLSQRDQAITDLIQERIDLNKEKNRLKERVEALEKAALESVIRWVE